MARPRKSPDEIRHNGPDPRLTLAERMQIEHAAAAHGITASEFMRRRSLGYRLPPSLAEQRNAAVAAASLVRLGNNLNQIARHMNRGNPAPAELPALLSRIHSELDRLYGPGDNGGRPVL